MRHDRVAREIARDEDLWAEVATSAPNLRLVPDAVPPFRPTPAVPDMPGSVGWLIVAVYAALLGAFVVTMAGSAQLALSLIICFVYLAMFFAVPKIFIDVEGDDSKRPTFAMFMARGIDTNTGWMSGGAALAQMLIVPVALLHGVIAIGLISMSYLP